METENVDGDEAIYCDHCKKNVASSRKIEMCKHPEILIIPLKRFTSKFQVSEWKR
tara:strand:+ start:745 stop:909 length:165 start_codon:yes stop_codon:yes gene_type:complete